MRPSLTGFPRESFSGLFRQSLSAAELERMFEDDSTGSFEKLEQRLKTPKRPNASKPKSNLAGFDRVASNVELQLKGLELKDVDASDDAGSKDSGVDAQAAEGVESADDAVQQVEAVVNIEPQQVDEKIPDDGIDKVDQVDESDKFVSFTEDDLANMMVIEYEFEDPNMSLSDLSIFNKSLSLTDLREEVEEDGEQEEAPTAEDQKVRMLLSLLSIFLIRSISFLRPVSINLLSLSGYLTFYMEASKLSLIIFQGKKYFFVPCVFY